jgi:hypothetical protein
MPESKSRIGKSPLLSVTTDTRPASQPTPTKPPRPRATTPPNAQASPTAPSSTTGARKVVGRPAHQETYSKATITLWDTNIIYVDGLSLEIKKKNRTAVSRSEIIRGTLAAIERSGIDLTGATSEEAIASILLERLRS